jgi:hypothetical protein
MCNIVDLKAAVLYKINLFDGRFHLIYTIGDIFILGSGHVE